MTTMLAMSLLSDRVSRHGGSPARRPPAAATPLEDRVVEDEERADHRRQRGQRDRLARRARAHHRVRERHARATCSVR